jgi:hypothetical protein
MDKARKIPGTESFSIVRYRSHDNSYREVDIVDADGTCLGHLQSMSRRMYRPAAYKLRHGSDLVYWVTLAEAARFLVAQKEES